MATNEAKNHHFVPQFYMRRFVCADDEKKVAVLERDRDALVADRESIKSIGYERLHDYDDNVASASIEVDLNKAIETPFSKNTTWLKISGGNCAGLDETIALSRAKKLGSGDLSFHSLWYPIVPRILDNHFVSGRPIASCG